MPLELTVLEFNHDRRDDAVSALNIRRNASCEVPLPEYRRGRSVSHEDSRMAYALAPSAGRLVTVRATFTRAPSDPEAWEIRADGGGVLGPVGPSTIRFPAGARVLETRVALANRRFEAVGRHDVEWVWRCRPAGAGGPWSRPATTRHRVYLVLDVPGPPWSPDFGSPQNPWTDLLDFSCVLAGGQSRATDVTRSIVQAVNARLRLKYDIEVGRARYFTSGFALTEWIERALRGHRSEAPYLPGCPRERYWKDWVVNCYDCGGAVTLMASVVGARVGYRTQTPFGYLRLVRPIGRGPCNNPFYGCDGSPVVGPDQPRSRFGIHAFAVLAGRDYDACLRVCVPWVVRASLRLAWALVVLLTCGFVRPRFLLDRADGWLVGLDQIEYQYRVIGYPPGTTSTGLPGKPESAPVPFR